VNKDRSRDRPEAQSPARHSVPGPDRSASRALGEQLLEAGVSVVLGGDRSLLEVLKAAALPAQVMTLAIGVHVPETERARTVASSAELFALLGDGATSVGLAPVFLVIVGAGAALGQPALRALLERASRAETARVSLLLADPDQLCAASLVVHVAAGSQIRLFSICPVPGSVEVGSATFGVARRGDAGSSRRHDALPGRVPPREHAIEVAVLGPVEIRGGDEEFERRPRLTELVVYLAMHPAGATSASWSNALWPERRVPLQTIANRLSEARRALGVASDRRSRLRKVADRHLIVETTTDWQRFRTLAGPGSDLRSWRQALELVRGRPFSSLPEGQWVTFEGFEAEVEKLVVECALRAGDSCLEMGDAEGATWAAHQGLRVGPWDERLYRLLMRAADVGGNRAGVEQAMRTLALVLEIEGDPLQSVHPETASLYRRLLGRTAAGRH